MSLPFLGGGCIFVFDAPNVVDAPADEALVWAMKSLPDLSGDCFDFDDP